MAKNPKLCHHDWVVVKTNGEKVSLDKFILNFLDELSIQEELRPSNSFILELREEVSTPTEFVYCDHMNTMVWDLVSELWEVSPVITEEQKRTVSLPGKPFKTSMSTQKSWYGKLFVTLYFGSPYADPRRFTIISELSDTPFSRFKLNRS